MAFLSDVQLLHIFFVGCFFHAISTTKFVGDTKPEGPRKLLWPGQNAVTLRDWRGRGHGEESEINYFIKFCKARVKKDWQWEALATPVTLRKTHFLDRCLCSVLTCLFMKTNISDFTILK